jgi:hypothetical protein
VRTDDWIAAAAAGRSRLKASDSDRDRVLDMLKAAFAQGRLTKDEFDARVGQTLLARTWGDLTELTDDIPAWPLPRPAHKPARQPSGESAPALIKAVACAIIALSAVTLAGMPGMWTMPAPPSMTAQACQIFYGWRNPHTRGIAMLNQAVFDARTGSNYYLVGDLARLQKAQVSLEHSRSPTAVRQNTSLVNADTSLVSADCTGS